MSGQTGNKPLFSQHYLEHRPLDSPEWQEDVSVTFSRLESLYQQKKAILPTLNEAQTEAELIQPILEILGFSYIPQLTLPALKLGILCLDVTRHSKNLCFNPSFKTTAVWRYLNRRTDSAPDSEHLP